MDLFSPKLIVISAPSGTGKTSIFKSAQKIFPNLTLSVSYTTRNPREGEKQGVDYFFVSPEEFQQRIKDQDFLEWAEVYGNFYGSSKEFIKSSQKSGNIVLLDIDVQGAMQLRQIKNLNATFVFITPPSLEVLEKRLVSRGTETPESLKKRLGNAEHELTFQNQYDYTVVNDELDQAVRHLLSISLQESIDLCGITDKKDETILKEVLHFHDKNNDFVHPVLRDVYQQILSQT
ncbi:MAG: guanylate kinase [SAR324 cluster bacterium]|uniref:Guanylate kinase n=1 Tax=SAR324 cluster bacterium TaxID=2024889 RepID=A0A2A4T369_9DELT|nr:MAG: guanylate kinase [SAR324 cluster bacterium]